MNAFQCDLTVDTLEPHIPQYSVDIATLVFVLSAIHPDKMLAVLQNIIQVKNNLLIPGHSVLHVVFLILSDYVCTFIRTSPRTMFLLLLREV